MKIEDITKHIGHKITFLEYGRMRDARIQSIRFLKGEYFVIECVMGDSGWICDVSFHQIIDCECFHKSNTPT